jgi:hypothetical protein
MRLLSTILGQLPPIRKKDVRPGHRLVLIFETGEDRVSQISKVLRLIGIKHKHKGYGEGDAVYPSLIIDDRLLTCIVQRLGYVVDGQHRVELLIEYISSPLSSCMPNFLTNDNKFDDVAFTEFIDCGNNGHRLFVSADQCFYGWRKVTSYSREGDKFLIKLADGDYLEVEDARIIA